MHCHCTAVVIQCPQRHCCASAYDSSGLKYKERCIRVEYVTAYTLDPILFVVFLLRILELMECRDPSACTPCDPLGSGYAFYCFSPFFTANTASSDSLALRVLLGVAPRVYQLLCCNPSRANHRLVSFKLHRNSLVIVQHLFPSFFF